MAFTASGAGNLSGGDNKMELHRQQEYVKYRHLKRLRCGHRGGCPTLFLPPVLSSHQFTIRLRLGLLLKVLLLIVVLCPPK